MAIDAKCPHCEKAYRLKDDLAGKKVTCANQACRQVFTITALASVAVPAPAAKVAAPKPKAAPAANADDLAAAALRDDPEDIPEDQKKIAMKCEMCEFAFEAAWTMQGKFTICPDCKTRQKVPMQEKGKIGGWRERNAPEGAKFDKLDDVTSAADTKMVSGKALRETGAIKEEFEARPMSYWAKWASLVGVVLLAGYFTFAYFSKNRSIAKEEKVIADYEKVLESDDLKPLPMYQAALRIALGEYEARLGKEPAQREKAIGYFTGAMASLGSIPNPRGADCEQLYGELAMAILNLGGDGEDVLDKRKLSWLPPQQTATSKAKVKPSQAELEGVQGQLRRVLQGLKDARADFDTRTEVLRRLTREVVKRNQVEVVRSTIPAFFSETEQLEAEAQVGLECFRGGKTDIAREIAEKFKTVLAAAPSAAPVPSIQALWNALDLKGPTLVPAPSGSGDIADASRFAFTALAMLKNNPAEAKTVAMRGGPAASRLRALALAAEWSEKPGEFVDSAVLIARDEAKKKEANSTIPGGILLRLAQASARAGVVDKAEEFVKQIPDENLRSFAKAEVLRNRLAADRGQQPKDDEAEIPADPDAKKLKLGHAWGRYHLARHNGLRTGDAKLGSAYSKWLKNIIAPFGQIGVTLGIQDAARK